MNNDVICVYPPLADKSAKICVLFNLNGDVKETTEGEGKASRIEILDRF